MKSGFLIFDVTYDLLIKRFSGFDCEILEPTIRVWVLRFPTED